jgi:hypothetical protein
MGFRLIDLLFAIASIAIGMVLGGSFTFALPTHFRSVAAPCSGLFVYLILIYPFYRGLKLFPMILPRCPCCGKLQNGFHIIGRHWPCITFRCPSCMGEFVIWHNGTPGKEETWKKPVLALKWPYAFGTYRRMRKPEPSAASNSGSATSPTSSRVSQAPPPGN